jgi:hypothetical protein
VNALVERLRAYVAQLERAGLSDRQVRATWERARRRGLARALGLLALAPLALLGAALNWVPYRIIGRIAHTVRDEPDQPATYKLLASLILYPIVWTAEAWLAARVWGGVAGCALALVAPLTGWLAVRFQERWGGLLRGSRAWWLFRRNPQRAAELRALRHALRRDVMELQLELAASE